MLVACDVTTSPQLDVWLEMVDVDQLEQDDLPYIKEGTKVQRSNFISQLMNRTSKFQPGWMRPIHNFLHISNDHFVFLCMTLSFNYLFSNNLLLAGKKKGFKHPFKIEGQRTYVINGWNCKRLLQKLHNHVNVFISISVNKLLQLIWCSFNHDGFRY